MVPSKKCTRTGSDQSKEWVKSTCNEAALNAMVFDNVLLDQATTRWCPAVGECYLTSNPSEIIIFESFFYRGFGLPAHPFLRNLLLYYGKSLCHLISNSILHIAIFINLYEAFLAIDPHFNLFHHFFCLKPIFGSRAPKIISGMYLVLWDGMADQYKTVPLNSLVKARMHSSSTPKM